MSTATEATRPSHFASTFARLLDKTALPRVAKFGETRSAEGTRLQTLHGKSDTDLMDALRDPEQASRRDLGGLKRENLPKADAPSLEDFAATYRSENLAPRIARANGLATAAQRVRTVGRAVVSESNKNGATLRSVAKTIAGDPVRQGRRSLVEAVQNFGSAVLAAAQKLTPAAEAV